MAMIDANAAKKILGCDDATLNSHINSGALRAQRAGGKLMVEHEDVEKLVKEKDDEGTIVLTGDSDDLSIDLGKVADDSAETVVGKRGGESGAGTESITFGDELEVVNFDDKTSELVFDETKQTGNVQNLSFTDSNTAVLTAVDETSVGATTAPIDFQTSVDEGGGPGRTGASSRSATGRRSRSAGRAAEVQPVHWMWPTFLVLTAAIGIFFIAPYYVISMYPFGDGDEKLANKDRRLGSDDNAWVSMAGGIAGFSVEPNKEKWSKLHGGEGEWIDMKNVDPQAQSRIAQYRGDKKEPGERLNSFVITAIDEEKKIAKAGPGTEYPIREIVTQTPSGEIKELNVEIFSK